MWQHEQPAYGKRAALIAHEVPGKLATANMVIRLKCLRESLFHSDPYKWNIAARSEQHQWILYFFSSSSVASPSSPFIAPFFIKLKHLDSFLSCINKKKCASQEINCISLRF